MSWPHRTPLQPLPDAIERRRIWNWFYVEKMDTVDIARALNISEADAARKLTSVREMRLSLATPSEVAGRTAGARTCSD